MANSAIQTPIPPNSDDYDSLPLQIPPLDPLFFCQTTNLPDPHLSNLGFSEEEDFELNLDDFPFPSEADEFFADIGIDSNSNYLDDILIDSINNDDADVARVSNFRNFNDSGDGDVKIVEKFDNYKYSESDNADLARVLSTGNCNDTDSKLSEQSGNDDAKIVENLSYTCLELDKKELVFCNGENLVDRVVNDSPPHVYSGPVSSQGSGNCLSGFEVLKNNYSPGNESGDCDRDISSNIVEDEMEMSWLPKRKKENADGKSESRRCKARRGSVVENGGSLNNEVEDEKKKSRLMRNRESAQLSRQRKKHYVEELEDKVRKLNSTLADLNNRMSFIMAENAGLRQQLAGGGMCAPPPGMYPTPMAYPWAPYGPYVVKPQGSQVPLVPIPRLRPQRPVSSLKAKKSESKKTEGKTKKVASVSFLGLLFFIFLIGGLVPMVNNKYGGNGENFYGGIQEKVYGQHWGRILAVNGHLNGSEYLMGSAFSDGKFDLNNREHCERHCIGKKVNAGQNEGPHPLGNVSEPLVASLYVPRNDKLVKIDGNLIIHSVLASEKAIASQMTSGPKNNEETGLALPSNLAPVRVYSEAGRNRVRQSSLYRNPTERQRALAAGPSNDHRKSTSADGKLQQWFREGLAGPLLSTGMCTEVFQFDISPASNPGAIVAASSVTNSSENHRQDSTHPYNLRNRRTLQGLPLHINKSALNITEEHVRRNSQKDDLQGNETVSPMVVSVLVDPREAGDDIDDVVGPKSLSRIFVVVLLDSVKYVTYSCMLPLKGSGPHRVTT